MSIRNKSDKFTDNVPRRWGILPTLDGYILREFLLYFGVLIFVFIILFILGDVFNNLSDFLEKHAPFSSMLSYYMLKLPGHIRFILPISTLLACMWTMAIFGKNMEVTAMRASGVSLFRCSRSVIIVGLLVTGVNFWFNEHLIPRTENEAETIFYTATKKLYKLQRARSMLTYRSNDRRRTWFFSAFKVSDKQNEVRLKSFRSDGSLEWDIAAKNAEYDPKTGWTFKHVILTRYSADGFMPKKSQYLQTLVKSPQEIPETPQNILDAISPPEELPSWKILHLLTSSKNMAQRCKDIYWSIFFYRLAFPWACVLAVFLGIPLATKNERSGVFTAIITAVILIVAYQVTSELFLIMGKRGVLNPLIAGLAPTVGFIIFGWYNVIKQRN